MSSDLPDIFLFIVTTVCMAPLKISSHARFDLKDACFSLLFCAVKKSNFLIALSNPNLLLWSMCSMLWCLSIFLYVLLLTFLSYHPSCPQVVLWLAFCNFTFTNELFAFSNHISFSNLWLSSRIIALILFAFYHFQLWVQTCNFIELLLVLLKLHVMLLHQFLMLFPWSYVNLQAAWGSLKHLFWVRFVDPD